MVDFFRCCFDHKTKGSEEGNSLSIESFEIAVASPDVGTAGMRLRVSACASCYRRVFTAALVVLYAETGGRRYSQRQLDVYIIDQ